MSAVDRSGSFLDKEEPPVRATEYAARLPGATISTWSKSRVGGRVELRTWSTFAKGAANNLRIVRNRLRESGQRLWHRESVANFAKSPVIRAAFLTPLQRLICRSREIAATCVPHSSTYVNRTGRRFLV
jgi:hypothetical protein